MTAMRRRNAVRRTLLASFLLSFFWLHLSKAFDPFKPLPSFGGIGSTKSSLPGPHKGAGDQQQDSGNLPDSLPGLEVDASLPSSYSYARYTRTIHGHAAAVPIYQDLLHRNPEDKSAASRIAASPHALRRQDTLRDASSEDIMELKRLLVESGYTASSMHRLFGAPVVDEKCTATGPVYVRPVTSGKAPRSCPFTFLCDRPNEQGEDRSPDNEARREESRKCLAALFLLGFSGK